MINATCTNNGIDRRTNDRKNRSIIYWRYIVNIISTARPFRTYNSLWYFVWRYRWSTRQWNACKDAKARLYGVSTDDQCRIT